jgi:hypothetical protein
MIDINLFYLDFLTIFILAGIGKDALMFIYSGNPDLLTIDILNGVTNDKPDTGEGRTASCVSATLFTGNENKAYAMMVDIKHGTKTKFRFCLADPALTGDWGVGFLHRLMISHAG